MGTKPSPPAPLPRRRLAARPRPKIFDPYAAMDRVEPERTNWGLILVLVGMAGFVASLFFA